MPDPIRIRAYNVLFGDCVLLSVDDAGTARHVLFDFGNAPGKCSSNAAFGRIAQDIRQVTGGTLDLVVMTHEHLDHMEGFYSQRKIFDKMTVRRVWMSIPSQPGYYQKHPKSEKAKKLTQQFLAACRATFRVRGARVPGELHSMLLNNLKNEDRIDYVRGLAGKKKVYYLYRGRSTKGKQDFTAVKFKILAPEKEMSVYYGHSLQFTEGMTAFRREMSTGKRRPQAPPPISATDFERLRQTLLAGDFEAVHEIDKAENNTSLVVLIEAAGKKLLFAGDAEEGSWEKMLQFHQLGDVDFLKVAHHGSWNGTPKVGDNGKSIVEILFPQKAKKTGVALISTKTDCYGVQNPVPDADTVKLLRKHCKKVHITEELPANELCCNFTV